MSHTKVLRKEGESNRLRLNTQRNKDNARKRRIEKSKKWANDEEYQKKQADRKKRLGSKTDILRI